MLTLTLSRIVTAVTLAAAGEHWRTTVKKTLTALCALAIGGAWTAAQAQGKFSPARCDLKPGHFLVNSGVLYLKSATEARYEDQKKKDLAEADRVLTDALTNEIAFTNEPESVQAMNAIERHVTGEQLDTEFLIVRSPHLTVDDPATYPRPFTMSIPLTPLDGGDLLPYECHEGNEAIRNSLGAERAEDRGERDAQADPRRVEQFRTHRVSPLGQRRMRTWRREAGIEDSGGGRGAV